MPENFHIVIPARLQSTRLPRKVLLDIAGKPMIQHVWERAISVGALSVTVATDSDEIRQVCEAFGASVCMTSAAHESGTQRIAEVATEMAWGESEIVVNVQGDEPNMPAQAVIEAAALLRDTPDADIATLATPILDRAEFENPNCVKVIADQSGRALLFTRAPVPYQRTDAGFVARRHLGLYAYRTSSLQRLVAAEACALERTESLEQLRALWIGQKIVVADASQAPDAGIDTQADLDAARAHFSALGAG